MYGGGRPPFGGPPGPPYGGYMGYGPPPFGPPHPYIRPPYMGPRFMGPHPMGPHPMGPYPMRHPYNGPATMVPDYGVPVASNYGTASIVDTSDTDAVETKKTGKKSSSKADPVVTTPTLAFIQKVMKKWEMREESVEDSATKTRCEICKITVESETVYKVHILSSEHKARLEFRNKLNRSKIDQAKADLIAKVNSQIDDKDTEKETAKKEDDDVVILESLEKGDAKNEKKIAINIKYKGRHKERVPEKKTCKVCEIELPSIEDYMKHVQSLRHENKVNSKKKERERNRDRSKRGEDEDRGRNLSKERSRSPKKESDQPERLSRPGRFSGGDSYRSESKDHSRDEERVKDSKKSSRDDDLRDNRESRRSGSRDYQRDDDLRDDRESRRSNSRYHHRDDDLRDDRESRRSASRDRQRDDDLQNDRESRRSDSRDRQRDDLRDNRESSRSDSRDRQKDDDLRNDRESRRSDSKDHQRDNHNSSTTNNPQKDNSQNEKKKDGYVRLDSKGNPIITDLNLDFYAHQSQRTSLQPLMTSAPFQAYPLPETQKRVSRFDLNAPQLSQTIATPQINSRASLLPTPQPLMPPHQPPRLLRAPDLTDNKEYCTVCNVSLLDNEAFIKHIGGILHKERVAISRGLKPQGGPKTFTSQRNNAYSSFYENVANMGSKPKNGQNVQSSRYCALCDVPFQSEETFNRHTRGLMHIQKMKASGVPGPNLDLDRKRKLDQDGKLSCQICGIECFSLITYQSHLERIHGHKVAIPTPPEGAGEKTTRSSLHQFLQTSPEPIVGLMYINEFQDPNPQIEPSFECRLCKLAFDYISVKSHLISEDHTFEIFKKHHPEVIENLSRLRPGTERYKTNFRFFAHDVETQTGRGEIVVVKKDSVHKGPRVCRHFTSPKGCKLGSNCGFYHPLAKKTRYDDQLKALLANKPAMPLAHSTPLQVSAQTPLQGATQTSLYTPKPPLLATPQPPLLATPQSVPLAAQTPLVGTSQNALTAQTPLYGASQNASLTAQNASLTSQVLALMSQQPPSRGPPIVEVPPPRVELPPARVELPPSRVELPPARVELPPARFELPPARVELPPARVELLPARVELPPPRVEVAPQRVEEDPLEQLLPQLLLKSSLLAQKPSTSVISSDTDASHIADNARAIQQENDFLATILAALAAKKSKAVAVAPQPTVVAPQPAAVALQPAVVAPQILAPASSSSHWGSSVLNTKKDEYDPFEPSPTSPSHDSSYRAYQQHSYSDQRYSPYDRQDTARQYHHESRLSEYDSMRPSSVTSSSLTETLLQKLQASGSLQAPDLSSLAEQIRRLQNQ